MLRIALFTETFLPKVDGIVNTLCHLLDHLAGREHASLLFAPQGAFMRYAKTAVVMLPAAPWLPYPEFKIAWPFANARPWLESFQHADGAAQILETQRLNSSSTLVLAVGTARTRDQLLSQQVMGDAERARVALVTCADNVAVADKQVHVFERFYQVDGSARHRYGGQWTGPGVGQGNRPGAWRPSHAGKRTGARQHVYRCSPGRRGRPVARSKRYLRWRV
jgi:hypothetical protein